LNVIVILIAPDMVTNRMRFKIEKTKIQIYVICRTTYITRFRNIYPMYTPRTKWYDSTISFDIVGNVIDIF